MDFTSSMMRSGSSAHNSNGVSTTIERGFIGDSSKAAATSLNMRRRALRFDRVLLRLHIHADATPADA
jgi:hypothetical protein